MSGPVLADGVLDAAVDYMYSDTAVEMGGFFVGDLMGDHARIDAAIPALKAAGSSVNLTFDHNTWTDIVNIVDREHEGKKIVGWFHSHPGHGVFLSGYDEFIQTNFFPVDGMVALVVDPTDGALGWFSTHSGAIVEAERTAIAAAPQAQRPVAARSRVRSTAFFAALAFLILGFAAGYVVKTSSAPAGNRDRTRPAIEDENARLRQRVGDLEQRAATAQREAAVPPEDGPPHTHVIQGGDTLWGLAEMLLGDGSRWSELYAYNRVVFGEVGANGGISGNAVGKTIVIPETQAP